MENVGGPGAIIVPFDASLRLWCRRWEERRSLIGCRPDAKERRKQGRTRAGRESRVAERPARGHARCYVVGMRARSAGRYARRK